MASLLYKLGRFSFRRWFVVLPVWVALLAIVGGLGAALSQPASSSFSIPGIPSERAQDLLTERFPQAEGESDPQTAPQFKVVIATPDGSPLTSPENQEKVAEVLGTVRDIPDLAQPEAVGTGGMPPESLADAPTPEGQQPATQDWLRAVRMQQAGLVQKETAAGTPQDKAEKDAQAASPMSPDGSVYYVQAQFDTSVVPSSMDVTDTQREGMTAAVDKAESLGLDAGYNGQAAQSQSAPGGTSEIVGIVVALIVLAITFSSVVAATLPIITAIVGVGIAVSAVSALSGVIDVNEATPMLATMLGLAVAIDYSLFIASRYRHEVGLTDDRAHAAGRAVGTAGSAVVFAGSTVFIALAALSIVRIPFLTTMALAASGAVVIAVLIALTLLPALFGAFKGKVFALRLPFAKAPDPETEGVNTAGRRLANFLRRHPVTPLLAGVIALAVLAMPIASLQLALPSDSTADKGTPARTASDLLTRGFGDGVNGPLIAVIDAADVAPDQRQEAFATAVERFASTEDVANAQIMGTNGDPADPASSDTAQVLITPETGPTDKKTDELLQTLRDGQPDFRNDTGADYGITGVTAIQADVSERLQNALAPYLAIVVGLAFILLMIVFRSVVVPLIAALGFLLSVGATFGATVAIFQWGWGGVVEGAPLVSFMPIFLIGVVFGLAMDYQVFLVSRMREAYVHGDSPADAVVHGYKFGARVVTAAAVIMISVFGGFILEDLAFIKAMGFALAAAVLFDAFVVRMVIIPALMLLLGEKAWWLPRWLDRILPRVDVEGENLAPAAVGADGATVTEGAATAAGRETASVGAGAGAAGAGAAGAGAAATQSSESTPSDHGRHEIADGGVPAAEILDREPGDDAGDAGGRHER